MNHFNFAQKEPVLLIKLSFNIFSLLTNQTYKSFPPVIMFSGADPLSNPHYNYTINCGQLSCPDMSTHGALLENSPDSSP